MPYLDKSAMEKAINKNKGKFSPKYRAFNILQDTIEDVVQKANQLRKVIYGLKTYESIKQTPMEVGEDKVEPKVVEITKDESIRKKHEDGTIKEADMVVKVEEEKNQEQNIPNVHMLSVSPPHVDKVDQQVEIVKTKDVSENSTQNINPLIEEDMKQIFIDTTTKEKLCSHLVLVSVDEIEKVEFASVGKKTQELSISPPQST